jgi:hypothetical protein
MMGAISTVSSIPSQAATRSVWSIELVTWKSAYLLYRQCLAYDELYDGKTFEILHGRFAQQSYSVSFVSPRLMVDNLP